jgi:hypothetical protein
MAMIDRLAEGEEGVFLYAVPTWANVLAFCVGHRITKR